MNNDSIYFFYERYGQDTKPIYSITKYNPAKTDKIIYYSGDRVTSYSFTKPDFSYIKNDFNDKGQKTYERIGALKNVKNKVTLKNKTEDFYTEKKWNKENKLFYLKTRKENIVTIKEYVRDYYRI